LIYTAGLIISSLLVWYEIDKSNPILKKICTGLVKTNCDAVLNSKQSKIFNTVSWGEIGFYYYSGSLLTILFAPVGIYSIQALGWLAILALPYTVFSIYYQWKIVKEWCTLCLTVQFLLIINAIIISFSDTVLFPLEINGVTSFLILILFIIVPLLWYAIKPLAYKIQKSTNSSREYNRLKYNTEIFETLLLKQKSITAPLEGLGIDLGDPSASNLLVKVCNPYCGPCANAHPRIEELINQNTNIKAKIIFTTKNDPSHPAYNPTRHLLAIAEIGNENMTRKALDDWYLANNKEYEQFSIKFPVNGDLQRQAEKMVKMDAWCAKMEINHTPTIFVNGFQLPDAYDIEDLKYFLLD
jgi:uncharacterized membrane protein